MAENTSTQRSAPPSSPCLAFATSRSLLRARVPLLVPVPFSVAAAWRSSRSTAASGCCSRGRDIADRSAALA
jgi:hypothetical protein